MSTDIDRYAFVTVRGGFINYSEDGAIQICIGPLEDDKRGDEFVYIEDLLGYIADDGTIVVYEED
jgi:hypothetical protein